MHLNILRFQKQFIFNSDILTPTRNIYKISHRQCMEKTKAMNLWFGDTSLSNTSCHAAFCPKFIIYEIHISPVMVIYFLDNIRCYKFYLPNMYENSPFILTIDYTVVANLSKHCCQLFDLG